MLTSNMLTLTDVRSSLARLNKAATLY